MKENKTSLFKLIFKKDSLPWLGIQTLAKLFYFLKLILINPAKYVRLWRVCFNKKFTRKGLVLHVYGPDLLKDAVEVCETVGVKPFLVFGTLLGFVRENDFIPHDNDIDLGLLDEDFQKKHLIKEIFLKKGYKHRIDDDYRLQLIHPAWPDLFIEFYRAYKKDDRMIIGMLSEDGKNTLFCYNFPFEAMNEFRIVDFRDIKISIPMDPSIFLSAAYGKWQIPRKEHDFIYDYENLYINDVKHQKSENN